MLFPALVLATMPSTVSSCSYSHGTPKASFDLDGLVLSSGRYKATDTYVRLQRPFDYYFNLCKPVPAPDPLCEAFSDLGSVVAYQVENATITNGNKKKCTALGVSEKTTFELLDADETKNNGFLGVRIKFEGGTPCHKEGSAARSFAVNVLCTKEATTQNFISTVSEDIDEGCMYEVDIHSIYGCPTECHSQSHDNLCSGHGVCGMDSESQRARCFCNEGWTGADCLTEFDTKGGTSSASINTTLMVFVILLLIALLYLSYVLYGKIKALNADDNPYGALEDQRAGYAGGGNM